MPGELELFSSLSPITSTVLRRFLCEITVQVVDCEWVSIRQSLATSLLWSIHLLVFTLLDPPVALPCLLPFSLCCIAPSAPSLVMLNQLVLCILQDNLLQEHSQRSVAGEGRQRRQQLPLLPRLKNLLEMLQSLPLLHLSLISGMLTLVLPLT